jgi:hypothetical protein
MKSLNVAGCCQSTSYRHLKVGVKELAPYDMRKSFQVALFSSLCITCITEMQSVEAIWPQIIPFQRRVYVIHEHRALILIAFVWNKGYFGNCYVAQHQLRDLVCGYFLLLEKNT